MKSILFDTSAVFHRFVPVKGNGAALEHGNEQANDEVEQNSNPYNSQEPAEPTYNTENTVVQKDQRRLDKYRRGKIHDLDSHKQLAQGLERELIRTDGATSNIGMTAETAIADLHPIAGA
ncbi:MAG: hypothetical protein Q9199_006262 [Rusavskia elegans]